MLARRIAIAFVFSVMFASGATIAGTVVDDFSGAAVPKPEVRVSGRRPPSTDLPGKDDGTFQSGDLAPGDYTFAAWSPGYATTSTSVHITSAAGSIRIRLVRLAAIEGQLTGLQGWTAKVLALTRSVDKKTGSEIWKPVLENFTRGIVVDPDGRFRIPDLPPGIYALLVSYSNSGVVRYPDGNGALELNGDGTTLSVQIPVPSGAPRTVEGQIELPDPQSWYWITLSNPAQPALAVATTITDDKGAFAFRGIAPGAYELLAVPGEGERGTPTPSTKPPFHGFARAPADLREQDVRGLKITPQPAIKVSVALLEAVPTPKLGDRCFNGTVTLLPIEDWGVWLERRASVVKISNDALALSPESIDGMAPARYGVSVENPSAGCLVADNPVMDLTKVATGSIEAKMREPGTVKGQAETGSEVILIPDDFAEGWSYLPENWFSRLPFGARLRFRMDGPYLSHVRLAVTDAEGHFEFGGVPVGSYHIGLRATGPAPGRQGMKPIDVPPASVVEIGLAAP